MNTSSFFSLIDFPIWLDSARPRHYALAAFLCCLLLGSADLQAGENFAKPIFEDPLTSPFHRSSISLGFMEDLNAQTLGNALAYTAGLQTSFTDVNDGDGFKTYTAYRLRGFLQLEVLRNGHPQAGPVDLFNVTQIDILRGPDVFFNTQQGAGGAINYQTLKPTDEPSASTEFSIGSDEAYRWSMRASGPINPRWGYSIAAVAETTDTWYDHGHSDWHGIAPTIEFKPFVDTSIRLGLEYLKINSDMVEPRFRTEGLLVFPDEALNQLTGNMEPVPYVDGSLYPEDGEGFLRFPGSSDEFRWGSDGYHEVEDLNLDLQITQAVGEYLKLSAGYNYSMTQSETFEMSPLKLEAIGFILTDPNRTNRLLEDLPWLGSPGSSEYQAYNDPFGRVLSYNWIREMERFQRNQFHLEARYDIPYEAIGKHTVALGGQYEAIQTSLEIAPLLSRDNLANGSFVPGIDPYEQRFELADSHFKSPYDPSPFTFDPRAGEFFAATSPNDLGPRFFESDLYAMHQGRFLEKRVQTVTNVSYKESKLQNVRTDRVTGRRSLDSKQETDASTDASFGISARPSSDSPWSIYFLAIRNSPVARAGQSYDVSGRELSMAEEVRSREAGLHFSLFDTKVAGSLSVFKIERRDRVAQSNELFLPPGASIEHQPNGTVDDRSSGADFEVVFTDLPIRNLQTTFNISYLDYEVTRFSGLTYEDPDPTDRPGQTPPIFFEKDLFDGDHRHGAPEWSANLWSHYQFRSGSLAGLKLGLGLRWVDERETILYVDNEPLEPSYQVIEDRLTVDAMVAYNFQFKETDCKLQLNIYNLTDETTRYGYTELQPRNFRLSLQLFF